MNAFIEYELKVAIALAVFTLFYKLLLQRDTFHRFNRIVLLVTSALAFVLPFCVIVKHVTMAQNTEMLPEVPVTSGPAEAAVTTGVDYMAVLETGLVILFFLGAAFMLLRVIYSIGKIRQLINSGRHIPQKDGTTLVVVNDNDFSPVSWMKYIVMSEEDYSSTGEGILIHERAHIALGHSWDILFFDLMTVMQWFNPAIWLLKADLRAIHEYEADEAVITAGTDMREYQLLLVRKAVAQVRYQAANSLTHSTLKNRIKMMSSKKSSLYGALKALYVLPLVAISLMANAETKYDYVAHEPAKVSMQADTVKIRYRGETDGKEPKAIIIVDGKVVETLDDIDPATIESMSVIKQKEAFDEIKEKYNVETVEAEGVIIVKLKKDGELSAVQPENGGELSVVKIETVRKPGFDGGDMNQFSKWLNMNLRYPEAAKKDKAEGQVVVAFAVDKDGDVKGVKVTKSAHPALDAEVVKMVSSSPKWTPAQRDGKAAASTHMLPVTFDIRGHNDDNKPGGMPETVSEGMLNEVYVTAYL